MTRISVLGFDRSVAAMAANVERTAREGFTGYWVPNGSGSDALTALAVVGAAVDIRLGPAVVPIHPRHPVALAQQALTVNDVLGGRLALGIGVSHRPTVEVGWGLDFDRPVGFLEEYLDALLPLLETGSANVTGERVSMRGSLSIDAPKCPVFVAALGPRMLELTGRRAAGTLTWMVGMRTIESLTVPTICEAAAAAGREPPEVVVGLPVCVTDDAESARNRAAESLARYGQLPSYRRMIEREGLEGPGDLCLIGGEHEVTEQVKAYLDAGATEIAIAPMGTDEEVDRSRECLAALVT